MEEHGYAIGKYHSASQIDVCSTCGETNAGIRYNHTSLFLPPPPKMLEGFPAIDKIIFTKLKCNICSGAC